MGLQRSGANQDQDDLPIRGRAQLCHRLYEVEQPFLLDEPAHEADREFVRGDIHFTTH